MESERRHEPAVPDLTTESDWPEGDELAEEPEQPLLAPVDADDIGATEVEQPTMDPQADARSDATTLLLRQSRSRLPRDAFRRGERWKARLPAAVHRARRHER